MIEIDDSQRFDYKMITLDLRDCEDSLEFYCPICGEPIVAYNHEQKYCEDVLFVCGEEEEECYISDEIKSQMTEDDDVMDTLIDIVKNGYTEFMLVIELTSPHVPVDYTTQYAFRVNRWNERGITVS